MALIWLVRLLTDMIKPSQSCLHKLKFHFLFFSKPYKWCNTTDTSKNLSYFMGCFNRNFWWNCRSNWKNKRRWWKCSSWSSYCNSINASFVCSRIWDCSWESENFSWSRIFVYNKCIFYNDSNISWFDSLFWKYFWSKK